MNSDDKTATISVLVALAVVTISCLCFPKAVVPFERALLGDSYARLLHPIGLRALGALFAVLFCVVLFGMLKS